VRREHRRQHHARRVAAIARRAGGPSWVMVDGCRCVAACRSPVHRCWHASSVAKRDS
jgi:hypothetical protein